MNLSFEMAKAFLSQKQISCYHCGESCKTEISYDSKKFCCDGCKLVYDLLKENNLCTYYNLNDSPGISPAKFSFSGKYDYLDNEGITKKLIRFTDGNSTHITFYIPSIHCSSCIWLLENLHRVNDCIISSSVDFLKKEATIVYDQQKIRLSEVVELMAHTGYEPLINLNDLENKSEIKTSRKQIVKIGLAGFCFGNIMMLSFPEYFSSGNFYEQQRLTYFFGYLNLLLSLPVFFYCASEFFSSAWKSIRNRYLNIDAPIALAILVTFSRSLFEIISHSGAGYMDSMSGIVFFMLIGRYFQSRTYDTLSFERDYKSYFPIGVTVKKGGLEISIPVSDLKKSDHIIIRNNEIIPSDAILKSSQTHIDYSFITGESAPVKKMAGELIYAGGKQLDGAIELEVVNPTSQSYLTQLWNQDKKNTQLNQQKTYVDRINKYFTIAVLSISALSGMYWFFTDSSKALDAMTAVLIVACPCGLLLTTTFANGNIMRILGRNKFYLKNSDVIEKLIKADTVILDKTGTITHGSDVSFVGPKLTTHELKIVSSLAGQSSHPLSRQLYSVFNKGEQLPVYSFAEIPGSGLEGCIDNCRVKMGSELFITGQITPGDKQTAKVFLSFDEEIIGYFSFVNSYRAGLERLVSELSESFDLKLVSGDNDSERKAILHIFGCEADIYFNQKPEDKMRHVQTLQQQGSKVIMIGDGLNDAGALRQSDVGIAVSDDTNNFSPACDAILDGSSFNRLPAFIDLARQGKKAIIVTFGISLTYNIIGLSFAVQGVLSPVVAAILMPVSSVTIVLLATISTTLLARAKDL
ncbi:MAG: heavy metal translocating P-type ATPase [Bacteroidota bacterium]|jgi:Cu+-exporting ATPase|nr:heavy metal translocating P-type ATPase [Bacteroidota bacterium]